MFHVPNIEKTNVVNNLLFCRNGGPRILKYDSKFAVNKYYMSYRITKIMGTVIAAYRRGQEDPLFDWLVEDMQLLLREIVIAAHQVFR